MLERVKGPCHAARSCKVSLSPCGRVDSKKLSDSLGSAHSEASVLPARANNFVYLNASSTTSSSFIVPIELLPTNVKPIKISALLDSGSSHCFLDNSIVNTYKLPTVPVNPPLQLWLIDGTSNHVIT